MKLHIAPNVQAALGDDLPVVALETTVITHGIQPPDNIDIALAMEETIRGGGACPATLGIVNGNVTVGLTTKEIEEFAAAERGTIAKCSRRDLPSVIGLGRHGSLTVAGTMMVARAAGIRVLATGGIGGVHRNHPFDISADLLELGRTPVAVVCAGAKSILDLELTLEVLESQGVPLIGVGTNTLPAFYAVDSGLQLPAVAQDIEEAARMYRAWRRLEPDNGLLLVTPVPADRALEPAEAESAIAQAVRESDAAGVSGNLATPFILQRVVELTNGRALTANKALLLNNARTAAELAVKAARAGK